jgi:hypothetical protein
MTYKDYAEAESLNYNKEPKNDTIALGFVLGEPKAKALRKLDNLVASGKIYQYSLEEKRALIKQGIKEIPEHIYRLIVNDSMDVSFSLELGFEDEKLSNLFFTSYVSRTGDNKFEFNNILEFLRKKFGPSQLENVDPDAGLEEHYWFDGYKEIKFYHVTRWTFYYRLTYSDLRSQVARKTYERKLEDDQFLNEQSKRDSERVQKKNDIR